MLRLSVIFILLALSSLHAEPLSEPRDYWLQINPGVRLHRTTMQVNGHGYLGLMTHSAVADWSLDVQSSGLLLSQSDGWTTGVYLLARSGPIRFNRQLHRSWDSSSEFDLEALPENLLFGDTSIVNAGTRMDGFYAYLVPVFYISHKKWKGVRVGGGIGPSYVEVGGTIEMFDSSAPYTFAGGTQGKTREEILRQIGYFHLTSGLIGSSTDPVRRAMLIQLDAPGMLENYGIYAYSRGWGSQRLDLYSLFVLRQMEKYFPYPLTPFEAYGLFSLSRTNVELKQSAAPAIFIYLEMPVHEFLMTRLSFGGPVFYHQGYQYNVRTFELAISVPLRF